MELRNIKTFIHAAEMESFTAAALRKNYAQSTVTQQIQAIERELGAELFVRSGRRVAGAQELARIESFISRAERMELIN